MRDILRSLGIVKSNKWLEVKANELVAGYLGQSSWLVNDAIELSKNGVLFVDEAYQLIDIADSGETSSALKIEAREALFGWMDKPNAPVGVEDFDFFFLFFSGGFLEG